MSRRGLKIDVADMARGVPSFEFFILFVFAKNKKTKKCHDIFFGCYGVLMAIYR